MEKMGKTIGQLFSELSESTSSYKFGSVGGQTVICVDGLMNTLKC